MEKPVSAFDALIVGYGPVGAMMAGLLANRGWRVAVVDRLGDVYPLPRAVRFDGEAMRLFQELGIAGEMERDSTPIRGGEFVDAHFNRLEGAELPDGFLTPLGWPLGFMFHQPTLERALRRRVAAFDGVTVFTSHEAGPPREGDDYVEIDVTPVDGGPSQTLRGSYLIAADGAASPTRKAIGASFLSLGYDCDWVVVDVLLTKPVPALSPLVQQICDPARVVTFVPVVGERRRWEFRLNPGEVRQEMVAPDKIWAMLAPWVTPDVAVIERAADYQFHAAIADRWRKGRVFLAGDAAHQTPPFLGEGMCAGLRDAASLAWKLDHVKRGLAGEALLDTYQQERGPHALDLVDHAVATGKLMDQIAAAQKGGAWPTSYAAAYGGERGFPHLHTGVLALTEDDPTDFVTGYQCPQPRVEMGDGPVLLDDALPAEFCLISARDVSDLMCAEDEALLAHLECRRVILAPSQRLSPELDELLAENDAIIVRPDRYVFGVANARVSLREQLAKLRSHYSL
ncbi:MAG: bifunctional 3-(3-hydroxy-phenyl)propionate/3-hydroxycinnamic acid hydroxylase [Alphaproteobacteria bacterium]|nr:bifunctional 3-(3-hydroxy-phenyl)propionate/3-hydroxycinnamic acid hydroxylase [Alphaproteobacteria bacterium]MDF1626231.1 bifunctional 3-(3-hydroxy-phenyl)propionate/3-hydroxycinnamic acid hydroxylase [Parvibaculaceae bacterium]